MKFVVLNDWGDELKAKKLPTPPEGEPLAIGFELSEEQQASYKTAKAKMMVSVCFVFLDDFCACKLWPNEALPIFFHEVRQLLKQAMHKASEDTRKQLILH